MDKNCYFNIVWLAWCKTFGKISTLRNNFMVILLLDTNKNEIINGDVISAKFVLFALVLCLN